MDRILIVDFGSQVLSLLPDESEKAVSIVKLFLSIASEKFTEIDPKAVILSGALIA